MKIRDGFISNSSSTAFIITNLTDEEETLTIVDFVRENPQLITQFVREYDWNEEEVFNQENLLKSAEENNEKLKPGENYVVFGDEDGTLIGQVFDYILRDGGSSKRFTWRFKEWQR